MDRSLHPWARAFAVASLVHLTLPDFDQAGWALPRLLGGVGAVWLLVRPSRAGFALCLLGSLSPLLFHRDVLTQSALLTACAALGVVGTRGVRAGVVWLTAGTYLLAVFHKLNTAFFDPRYSCADHAWAQVAGRWPVPDVLPFAPWAAVVLEVALAVALLRGSPWRWPLGILFHLPLTVTLAPAFGAVMLSGYVAAGSPREAVAWRRMWRSNRRGWVLVAGAVLAVVELAVVQAPLELEDGERFLKVFFAGALLAGSLLAWTPRRPTRIGAERGPTPRWVYVVVVLFFAHGLTPYVGWQYQHTAAMLSNLRIDAGCHNHLLMPASWVSDPYIRIDEARVGGRAARERTVRETLWNVAALHTMRRNWCVPENRPIRFAGTWRGERFTIDDLCADEWQADFPGLPGAQLFQKNLRRECPTVCVH